MTDINLNTNEYLVAHLQSLNATGVLTQTAVTTASGSSVTWGQIIGDIENQEDLMALISELEEKMVACACGDVDLSAYALKTDLEELATKDAIPENISELINDAGYITEDEVEAKGYLTEHQDLSNYVTKDEIPTVPTNVSELTNDAGYITEIPDEYVTETELDAKNYLTEHQSLDDYVTTDDLTTALADKANTTDLAAVATSGSYNDLTNTPDLSGYALSTDVETSLTAKANTDDLAAVATSGDYEDLINTPDHTKYAETANLATVATSGSYNDLTDQPTIPEEYKLPTASTDTLGGVKIDGSTITITDGKISAVQQDLSGYALTSNLANVATSGSYTDLANVPTNVSEFTNDANYITNAVNDLANYYLKTETYTQDEVDNLIGAISTISIQVVDNLPTENILPNVIYFVPKTGATNDVYNEYIYVDGAWELIGDTVVDLSNYVTTDTLSTELANKADTADLANVATSGNYNDLTNTPDLTVYATTSSLANVATTGSYNDLTGTPDEYELPIATNSVLGGVIVDGTTITATAAGVISATQQDLSNYVTETVLDTKLADKVDTSSLATVATTGAYTDLTGTPDLTVYTLSADLAAVATSGSYNDLNDQPTIPAEYTLPTASVDTLGGVKVDGSTITITNGTISAIQQDLSSYATTTAVETALADKADTSSLATVATTGSYTDLSNTPIIPDAYTLPTATTSVLGGVKIDGTTITITDGTISAVQQDLNGYALTANLATVATSGSYNDLLNTPTIPSEYTLPTATTTTLGGVMVDGTSITISNGVISATQQDLTDYVKTDDLATVATSGSYTDLTNTPDLTEYAKPSDITTAIGNLTGEDIVFSTDDTTSLKATIEALISRIEALENA